MLWLNLETKVEIDIDNEFNICDIRTVFYYNHKFYILTNKSQKKVGLYLIELDEQNPKKIKPRFLINKTGTSLIDDARLNICQHDDNKNYLVGSYKENKNNNYDIFVIHLPSKMLIFKYEMFCLWEQPIGGYLLQTDEFLILGEDGKSIL